MVLVFVLCAGSIAHAQAASSALKKGQPAQLVILSATANRASETLTIRGLNFGTEAPQVLCETHFLTVISATDSEIVVQLPAAVPDGTYLLSVVRGPSTNDRDVFHMAVQTPTVITGPEGPAGPVGAPGLQGEPGVAGPPGAIGATGAMGVQGPVGPGGPQGSIGPLGPAGPVGSSGATGAQGETGLPGAVGAQGSAGSQGDPGPQGAVGSQGPAGSQGLAGAQGEAGPVGPHGPAGPQGDRGPEGSQGAGGPQGIAGPQGPAGLQGPTGLQGPAGPAGPPGVSGYEIVTALSPVATVVGFGTFAMTATCPAGKHAIAGGYESLGDAIKLTPVASHPVTFDTWRVVLRSPQVTQTPNAQVRVYVVCALM